MRSSRTNPGRFAALLLLTAGLSGCIVLPIPHKNTLRPSIAGTLTIDGKPWSDAQVAFTSSRDWPSCAAAGDPVTTDSAGRFSFPIKKKRKYFVVAPLAPYHRSHTAAVCVAYEGAMRPIFVMQEYGGAYNFFQEGIGYLPDDFKLGCDLDSKSLGRGFDLTRCRSDPDWPHLLPNRPAPVD